MDQLPLSLREALEQQHTDTHQTAPTETPKPEPAAESAVADS